MYSEDSSNTPPNQSENQTLPQAPTSGATQQQNDVQQNSNRASNNEFDDTKQIQEEIRSGERWLIGINSASVIVTIIIALIYWGQLVQMRDATRAAQSAAKTADETLKAAQKSTWLDQRAWVTLIAGSTPQLLLNQPITLPVTIENSGRTPAEKVNGYLICEVFRRGEEKSFLTFRTTAHEYITAGPINPTSHITIPPIPVLVQKTAKPVKATPELIQALINGNAFVMMHGQLNYSDAWKVDHWIKVCAIPFGKAPDTFTKCTDYNDLDHNEPKAGRP